MRAAVAALGLCASWALFGCGDSSSDTSSGGSHGKGGSGGSGGSAGSGGTSSGGSSGSTGTGGAAGSGGSAGATPSAGCKGGTLAPSTATVKISFGGQDRQYILHVPASYDGTKPMPLVLNFHGYGSNMTQEELFTTMDAKSDSAGFVLAYPDGLPNPGGTQQSWNAGACCAFGDTSRDDVGFVNAVLDEIEKNGCIDQKRIYSTGMSNGGFMSHYLGCKLADRIAAIAPVAGVLGIAPDQCQPSRPMPIIEFHGTADTLVPYDGGGTSGFASVPDTFAGWAQRDGCTGTPKQSFQKGSATCSTYDSCKDGVSVTLCSIEGEGHCWPGQSLCPFGQATTDIVANDAMWDLFQKTTLP